MIKIHFTTHRHKSRSKIAIICNVILTFLISFSLVLPASAGGLTRSLLEYYNKNGIFFYNISNTLGANNTNCVAGSNTTVGGQQVFTEAQLSFINAHQSVYEAAAAQYGFPWQILAVLHAKERNLLLDNPGNGNGVYQILGTSYTPGPISEAEFISQTNEAATFVANIINSYNLNISNSTDIKRLFLYYNGTGGGHYADMAVRYGFSADEPWEGSPYVMNYYDPARSPMIGGFPSDGVFSDTYISQQKGAYTMYVALGGSGNDGCYMYVPGGYTLAYGANGMNGDEAEQLMKIYRDRIDRLSDDELIKQFGMTYNNCAGGLAYNCVSFSRYFINVYTGQSSNKITAPLGNGINLVSGLLSMNSDFYSCGPSPYAVFSGTGTTDAGHTGVILGINTADNKIITGEASCHGGSIYVGVYTIENFLGRYNNFACPNSINLSIDSNYQVRNPNKYQEGMCQYSYDTGRCLNGVEHR